MIKDLHVKLILIAAFVLTALLLGGSINRNSLQQSEISSLKQIVTRDSAAVVMYRNDWQRETARTRALQLSNRSLKSMMDAGQLTWIRQFSGVNRKLTNLEAAINIQGELSRSLELLTEDTTLFATVPTLDLDGVRVGDSMRTVQARRFDYVDEFNTIHGYVAGDTTYLYEVRISVPLEGAVYWQRRRILGLRLGRKDYFSDITSPNPWLKVKIEYIKIQKR